MFLATIAVVPLRCKVSSDYLLSNKRYFSPFSPSILLELDKEIFTEITYEAITNMLVTIVPTKERSQKRRKHQNSKLP